MAGVGGSYTLPSFTLIPENYWSWNREWLDAVESHRLLNKTKAKVY